MLKAFRIPGGKIRVAGLTHFRNIKCPGEHVDVRGEGCDWVVVRKPGKWKEDGESVRFVVEEGVAFHCVSRCEAAAFAQAQGLAGGRVIKVEETEIEVTA